MLVIASERTIWNIKMRMLQSMTNDEYTNIFGDCSPIR